MEKGANIFLQGGERQTVITDTRSIINSECSVSSIGCVGGTYGVNLLVWGSDLIYSRVNTEQN